MTDIFTFLGIEFLVAVLVLAIILLIEAIRKRPIKKLLFAITGCYLGLVVFSGLMMRKLDPALAFLAIGFFVATAILVIRLFVQTIRKAPLKKIAWGILGCYFGMVISISVNVEGVKTAVAFIIAGLLISIPMLMVLLLMKVLTKQAHRSVMWCLTACLLALLLTMFTFFVIFPIF